MAAGPWNIVVRKALEKVWKRQGKKATIWLLKQIGGDWAFEQIQKAAGRASHRQQAIHAARHAKDGKFGSRIVDGKTHYIVFSGPTPIEVIPKVAGKSPAQLAEHYEMALLKDPDTDLSAARAKGAFTKQWAGLLGKLRRGEEQAEAELTVDPEAVDGEDLATIEDQAGKSAFEAVIADMPELLDRLTAAPAADLAHHNDVPQAPGVYLFSENGVPLYVGQSRNLRRRLREHTAAASRHNQAPFAFNLAKRKATEANLVVSGTRQELANNPEFAALFSAALDRVRNMDVQFIEIEDGLHRYIFEPFAAQLLGTEEFNSFETH